MPAKVTVIEPPPPPDEVLVEETLIQQQPIAPLIDPDTKEKEFEQAVESGIVPAAEEAEEKPVVVEELPVPEPVEIPIVVEEDVVADEKETTYVVQKGDKYCVQELLLSNQNLLLLPSMKRLCLNDRIQFAQKFLFQ